MPFDILGKKKGAKADASSAPEADKKSKKALAGKSFAEQSRALEPEKPRGEKTGGAKLAFMSALGLAGRKGDTKPLDATMRGNLETLAAAAYAAAGKAQNMSNRILGFGNDVEHTKADNRLAEKQARDQHRMERKTDSAALYQAPSLKTERTEAVRHGAVAQAAASKVVKAERALNAAIAKATATGKLEPVQVAATVFLEEAAAFHRAVFGHEGPEDYSTDEGIIGYAMSDLVGGRTRSWEEIEQASDPRTGERGEFKKQQVNNLAGRGLFNEGSEWSKSYQLVIDMTFAIDRQFGGT